MKEFFLGLWLSLSALFTGAPVEPIVGANSTISNLTSLSSADSNDLFPIVDTSAGQTKQITFSNATGSMKTFLDATYSPLAGSASITTVGTITSGTWNASTLTVPYGGTASTTLSANRLFVGNGTGNLISIGQGSSGQYLISGGAGVAPSFQTSSVDQTANYTWTGAHTFSGTSTAFTATTTFTGKTYGVDMIDVWLASTTIDGYPIPVPVFVATSTNSLVLSGLLATTTDFLGFAITDGTNGASTSVQYEGIVSGFSGLTKGAKYYISGTGTISTTMGTPEIYVGFAISPTEIFVERNNHGVMQFVGSQAFTQGACAGTCTATITMTTPQQYARMVVVKYTFTATGQICKSNVLLMPPNHVAVQERYAAYTTGSCLIDTSISGNTLTITQSTSGASPNMDEAESFAYFYR